MRQISWKSNTGNDNILNIGFENILKSTDPALPGGGHVNFELWRPVQGAAVGAVAGKIKSSDDWFDIVCTEAGSSIDAEAVVGNNTVVFYFYDTEGYFSGDVEVQEFIIYDDWTTHSAALIPSSNPLTIEISHSDNVFTSLHLSSGYMRFVGGYQDAEQFAASQPMEHPVKFYVNNSLEWQGYIKCETLQQNWYNEPVVINIPVVSPLGLLSGIFPSNEITNMGFKTIGDFLLDISALFAFTPYNSFIFPKKMKELLRSKLMMSLFCEWSETEQKYITESYADILTAICDAFGLQVQEYRDSLVFLTTDENTVTDSSAYTTFTATALRDYIDGTGDASSARTWEAQTPTFITTQQTISIHKGAKKVKVSADAGRIGNPVADLLDDRYFKVMGYDHAEKDITQRWNSEHPDDQYEQVLEYYDTGIVSLTNGMSQKIQRSWVREGMNLVPLLSGQQLSIAQKFNFFDAGEEPQRIQLYSDGYYTIDGTNADPGAFYYKERICIRGRRTAYDAYKTLDGDSDYTNRIVVCRREVNNSAAATSQDVLVLNTGIFIEPIKDATGNIFIFVNGTMAQAEHSYDPFKPSYWAPDMRLYIGDVRSNFAIMVSPGTEAEEEHRIFGMTDKFKDFRNSGGYFQYPDKDANPNMRGELKIVLFLGDMCETSPGGFRGWKALESLEISIISKDSVTYTGFDYTPTLTKELNNGYNNSISKSLRIMNAANKYHGLCKGLLYANNTSIPTTAYDNKSLQKALFDRIVEYYKVARSELRTMYQSGRTLDPTKYIEYSGIKYMPTAQKIDYATDQVQTYLNETIQS